MLNKIIVEIYDRIPLNIKKAFKISIVIALCTHGMILTNVLNNYDNIACTPVGYGTGLASGRWMLTILGDFTQKITGGGV